MSTAHLIRLPISSADSASPVDLAAELVRTEPFGGPGRCAFAFRNRRSELAIFTLTDDDTPPGSSVADAVLGRSLPFVDQSPDVTRLEIVAEKRSTDLEQVQVVTKAMLLVFRPRTGREDQAVEALRRSKDLAADEPGTTAWFAFRGDNNTFGIFDVFPGQHDRIRHLTGRIPRALLAACPSMLTGMKTFRLPDVLADSLTEAQATLPSGCSNGRLDRPQLRDRDACGSGRGHRSGDR